MSNEAFSISPEVRRPLDAYLDAVDITLLKAAANRGHRAAIVRDLETQLLDMLRERCAGREPMPADVADVLAMMDPPGAYAQEKCGTAALPNPRRKLPAHALWGAGIIPFCFISLMILMANFEHAHFTNPSDFLLLLLAGTPIILMTAVASLLGFSTWKQISNRPGRYWGRPVAALEIAAFPVLVLCASPLLSFALLLAGASLVAIHFIFDLRTISQRLLATF